MCLCYGIPCYDKKQIVLWIPASQGPTQNFSLETGTGLMLRLDKIYVWVTENNIVYVYKIIPTMFATKFTYIQKITTRSWFWLKYDMIHTGCPRRNVPDFGRVFLMLKYTDITQNTYVQSWTVTEIMARGKCGLLAGPRTIPVSWQVLSMFVLEFGVGFSSH